MFGLNNMGKINIAWVKDHLKNNEDFAGVILALLVLFVAALQEEILFRGYLAYILMPFGFLYALLFSTALFTLWHFITNKVNVFQIIDWILGGIMLFYIYWLSGSIWVSAVVHFSRNFTNVLIFNISGKNSIISYEEPLTPPLKTLYTILYSLLVISFGLAYYHFFPNPHAPLQLYQK